MNMNNLPFELCITDNPDTEPCLTIDPKTNVMQLTTPVATMQENIERALAEIERFSLGEVTA